MIVRGLGAVGLVLMAGACGAEVKPQSPPDGAAKSVCKPQFKVDDQLLDAGTAFVLAHPGDPNRRLLVTAIHLFGPWGGLDAEIPWAQLPARASLNLCAAIVDDKLWRGGKALSIPDAAAMKDDRYRDVAAFPLDPADSNVPALSLAATTPKIGDRVWLVGRVIGVPATRRLFPATVSYAGPEALQYQFDDRTIQLRATSGAPVVNAAGQVVTVNLGGGPDEGELYGVGPSLEVLTDALSAAR